jgi:hypothetical protein
VVRRDAERHVAVAAPQAAETAVEVGARDVTIELEAHEPFLESGRRLPLDGAELGERTTEAAQVVSRDQHLARPVQVGERALDAGEIRALAQSPRAMSAKRLPRLGREMRRHGTILRRSR